MTSTVKVEGGREGGDGVESLFSIAPPRNFFYKRKKGLFGLSRLDAF